MSRPTSKGSPDELALSVQQILRRILQSNDVTSKKLLKSTGLTTPQTVILQAVRELGQVTTRQISDHVSLSQGTVTTILMRLESKGLVERYRSAVDRRIVHTRLTANGRRILEDTPGQLQNRFVRNFTSLSARRQAAIHASLAEVARLLDSDETSIGGIHDQPVIEKE